MNMILQILAHPWGKGGLENYVSRAGFKTKSRIPYLAINRYNIKIVQLSPFLLKSDPYDGLYSNREYYLGVKVERLDEEFCSSRRWVT